MDNMNLHYIFSKYILLPFGKLYSGRNYFKALRYEKFLEKTQYWSDDDLDNLRNVKFQKLIKHCYYNIPYYKNLMDNQNLSIDSIKKITDITKLPILSKKDINENRELLLATNYKKNRVRFESTGGTTGNPVRFARDLVNEFRVDGNNWRFWKYASYIPGQSVALFWGNEIELLKIGTLREKLKLFMDNTKVLNFFDLSDDRIKNYSNYLNKSKPQIIRAYASAIFFYVQYCKQNNIEISYCPKCIILTADKIYDTQKKIIENYFKCETFEEYGCREFSIMAHECKMHQGLHLAEELFVFEILNHSTNSCHFIGRGELVVTPLFNYAMPLLRYRLGDEVEIVSEKCSCGRNLKIIRNIKGRIADFIITKSGKYIHGEFFSHLFYESEHVIQFQVQQYEEGNIIIYVVVRSEESIPELKRIQTDINKIFCVDLKVSFMIVDEIQLSPSGKRRPVVSHIASKYLS